MSWLLDYYKTQLEKAKQEFKELYEQKFNAGVGTEGDYKNRLLKIEKEIGDLEKRIQAIESKEQPVESKAGVSETTKVFIYVISGTNARIKQALTEEELYKIYTSLQPLNHDDEDVCKWKPFTKDEPSIEALLDTLQNEGFKFAVYYLNGYKLEKCYPEDASFSKPDVNHRDLIDEKIVDNKESIIAIIDLLALDPENEEIARRFDDKRTLRVFTAEYKFQNDKLENFMEGKKKVFKYLENKLKGPEVFTIYKPGLRAYVFLQELRTVIKKEKPDFNTIADKDSHEDNLTRILFPGFSSPKSSNK